MQSAWWPRPALLDADRTAGAAHIRRSLRFRHDAIDSVAHEWWSSILQIPLAQPDLTGNEATYVNEAVNSTWISSTGPFVDRFETEFASLCDTRTSLSVCNGTVALHLALLALDVRRGDEVLVPSLAYVAVANAVR